jgi:ribonuclease HI
VGIGIVARDDKGEVLGARAIAKPVVAAPKVAEAMAALEAVLFYKATGFFKVILERDAKQVIDEVISATPNLNAATHFVEGITAEIQGLRDVSMVHVGREANNAAHCLANEASSTFIGSVWLEEIPNCILHVVLRESLFP